MEIVSEEFYSFKEKYQPSNELWTLIQTIHQTAFFNNIPLFIAGGCLRRLVEGESFEGFDGDIDVFFKDHSDCSRFVEIFHKTGLTEKDHQWKITPHTLTTTVRFKNRDIKIQLIRSFVHQTVMELLGRFDIVPSMIATDCLTVSYHKDALEHIKNKNLVFNDSCTTGSAMLFLKRYLKFIKMGYNCSYEEDRKFLTQLKSIDKIEGIDYHNS